MSTTADFEALVRGARDADRRSFRRLHDASGACVAIELRWGRNGDEQAAVVEVTAAPEFLGWAFDDDGHAYQDLDLQGARSRLYPILDPISMEHAAEVETTILPAILGAAETRGDLPALDRAIDFARRVVRLRSGDAAAFEGLDGEADRRALEIAKADVNEMTDEIEVRRRSFLRYYQYRVCDDDSYRAKARESLRELVERVTTTYEALLREMLGRLDEEGFVEEA